jgi:hypothetical protein
MFPMNVLMVHATVKAEQAAAIEAAGKRAAMN